MEICIIKNPTIKNGNTGMALVSRIDCPVQMKSSYITVTYHNRSIPTGPAHGPDSRFNVKGHIY